MNRLSFICFIIALLLILPAAQPRSEEDSLPPVFQEALQYRRGDSRASLNTIKSMVHDYGLDPDSHPGLLQNLAALLKGNATYECRLFACRQLASIGTADQTIDLIVLLGDPRTQDIGRYALESIPGEQVDEALIDALEYSTGDTLLGLMTTLGHRGAAGAVSALEQRLASSHDRVVQVAAYTLGCIATEDAAEALNQALQKARGEMAGCIADAYLSCADAMLEKGANDQAAAVYQQVFESGLSPAVRAAALYGFARTEDEQATGLVLEALSAAEKQPRNMAMRIVQEVPGEEATRTYARQLKKLPPAGQAALLAALGNRGDDAAVEGVRKACKSRSDEVKAAAAVALGQLGTSEDISLLLDLATDSEEVVSRSGLAALTIMEDEQAGKSMTAMLSEASSEEQAALIKVLAARQYTEAQREILRVASEGETEARQAAFEALETLARPELIGDVVGLMIESKGKEQQMAGKVISSAISRFPGESGMIEELKAGYQKTEDIPTRILILDLLGRSGNTAALALLQDALEAGEVEERRAAVKALSQWPKADPLEKLKETAGTDDDKVTRVLALRGYIDLIGRLAPSERLKHYRTAMEMAESDAEKRKILSGVAALNSPGAVEFAEEYTGDKTLRQEAAMALLQLAENGAAGGLNAVEQLLKKVEAMNPGQAVESRIEAIRGKMSELAGYLLDWRVSPVYKREGIKDDELFEIVFAPEDDLESVEWQPMPIKSLAEDTRFIDFHAHFPGDYRAVYVRTRLWSPEEQPARLELGSDDGIKIWLNGELVHAKNIQRGSAPGQDKVNVTLQKGWNPILVKVTQAFAGWNLIARVVSREGQPLAGVFEKAE